MLWQCSDCDLGSRGLPSFHWAKQSNSHVLQLRLQNVKFWWGKFSSRHFHRVSRPCCLCFRWFLCERSVWYIALMLKPRLAYDGVCLSCVWHRWELGNSLNVRLKMDLCRPLLQAKTQLFAFGCEEISTGSTSAFSLVMSLFNVAQCSLIVPSGLKVRPFYWSFEFKDSRRLTSIKVWGFTMDWIHVPK